MAKYRLNKRGPEINNILEYAVLTNVAQYINSIKTFNRSICITGKDVGCPSYLYFNTSNLTNHSCPFIWIQADGSDASMSVENAGTVSSGTGGTIYKFYLGANSAVGASATIIMPHKSGTISLASNFSDGDGSNSVRMNQDGGATFSFTGKNQHATDLDSNLNGNLVNGAGTLDSSHTGQYAASFGGKSLAAGKRSLAEGTTTVAKGNYSHAEGDNSVSMGNDSHAEGYKTVSYGTASHSEGNNTQALGNDSHAEGTNTISNAQNSHAEGYESETRTSSSGRPTIPTYGQAGSGSTGGGSGSGSGGSSSQTGDGAHAEGVQTRACGNASHTEGISTWATAYGSHAEGYGCQAIKDYAHAEGYNCLASGFGAHATGVHTEAVGNYSFTQGRETKALKDLSSAFGKGTKANGEQQMVVGRYNNYTITDAYFMVGMGVDDDHRRNALAVMTDGTLAIPNFNSNGDIIGTKRIKCVNGVLTVID